MKMEKLTIEELCMTMGEDMIEINSRKAIAKNIRKLLDIIPRDNLDVLHYIIEPKDFLNNNFKMTDIFALKEYLLHISMFNEKLEYRENFNENLEEELWVNLTQKQLLFIELCLNTLNDFKKVAQQIVKEIHRGLRSYPFPEV